MNRAPLRVLVADDEPMARLRLARLLGDMEAMDVVAIGCNAGETVEAIRRHRPDAVFLDVQMPDSTGFDVLAAVQADAPLVVFVTAHAGYAVAAFEQQAVDYLLKPYTPERLAVAVERLRVRLQSTTSTDTLAVPPPAAGYATRIPVSVGRRIRVVAVEDIEHARAQANYVELHVGTHAYLLRGTITELMQRLDPGHFVRVHRSSIVRVAAVDSLEPHGACRYLLHMRGGAVVHSGRSYRDAVRDAFCLP